MKNKIFRSNSLFYNNVCKNFLRNSVLNQGQVTIKSQVFNSKTKIFLITVLNIIKIDNVLNISK